ncbi:J domain-containing protein [Aphelenchoides bicaudatus]|nr:J domain-containing protein [Aphelenchoides bicaudatus]
MVIEANRDAWRECVTRANEALVANDVAKAKRLLHKAHKLDPSFDVNGKNFKVLLHLSLKQRHQFPEHKNHEHHENNYNHFEDHYDNAEGLRSRRNKFKKGASSQSAHSGNSTSENSRANDTSEARQRSRSRSHSKPSQSESASADSGEHHVARIRHCKDYYEILQVSRDCNEVTLKKRYRELALKLHPDKCQAQGATEAFKALGNAYSVLSDPNKRDAYNASGMNPDRMNARQSRGFYEYDVNRGFESEVTPEEIFEMFFGGGFPSGSVYRRRGHYFHAREAHAQQEERSAMANLLQLLPLFVLLFGALFMQLLAGEPAFSLRVENGYTVQRFTKDLRVPYYVKPDFMSKYGDRIYNVEVQVEEDYVAKLRMNCYREKNQRETALWRAKMSGDNALWAHAQRMEMPNCRRLEEIYH